MAREDSKVTACLLLTSWHCSWLSFLPVKITFDSFSTSKCKISLSVVLELILAIWSCTRMNQKRRNEMAREWSSEGDKAKETDVWLFMIESLLSDFSSSYSSSCSLWSFMSDSSCHLHCLGASSILSWESLDRELASAVTSLLCSSD